MWTVWIYCLRRKYSLCLFLYRGGKLFSFLKRFPAVITRVCVCVCVVDVVWARVCSCSEQTRHFLTSLQPMHDVWTFSWFLFEWGEGSADRAHPIKHLLHVEKDLCTSGVTYEVTFLSNGNRIWMRFNMFFGFFLNELLFRYSVYTSRSHFMGNLVCICGSIKTSTLVTALELFQLRRYRNCAVCRSFVQFQFVWNDIF